MRRIAGSRWRGESGWEDEEDYDEELWRRATTEGEHAAERKAAPKGRGRTQGLAEDHAERNIRHHDNEQWRWKNGWFYVYEYRRMAMIPRQTGQRKRKAFQFKQTEQVGSQSGTASAINIGDIGFQDALARFVIDVYLIRAKMSPRL